VTTAGRAAARSRAWLRPVVALLALVALAVALGQPIWVARLEAPQYPKGLTLAVYGDRLEGDVREVNGLNHYIGMRTIDPAVIPEMRLWPLAPAFAAAFAVAGIALGGAAGLLARIALWLVPLVVLLDIQRWLMVFGRELDRDAALRLKPFVPLAVGPTAVWNFRIWAMPGPALLLMFAVALAVMLAARAGRGPGGAGWLRRLVARGAHLAVLALALSACSAPVAASDAHPVHSAVPVPLPARLAVTVPAPAAAPAGETGARFDLAAAVAAAPVGAELHVPSGTYPGPLTIDRPITLIADGTVLLDGGGRGTVLTVRAPSVVIRGFTIHGSGGQVEDAAGIAVLADDVTVEQNRLHHVYAGVLVRGTHGVRIVGNLVEGPGSAANETSIGESHQDRSSAAGDGVTLWNVSGALVRGNTITGMRDGVYLSYAEDVLVDSNRITDGRYAVHAMFGRGLTAFGNEIAGNASGLVLMNTEAVEAARNHLTGQRSSATGYAVLLKDVRGARLVENVVSRNVIGVRADGVDRNAAPAELIRNDFSYNGIGVQLLPSSKLVFTRNSFVDNLVQVDLPGAVAASGNEWTKAGLGNYWSGYGGFDLGGDGAGDLPHREGVAAVRLLEAAPELLLFRGSLAMHVLERAERWWDLSHAATAVDPLPLVRPQAPRPDELPAEGGIAWLLLAAALVGGATGATVAVRRSGGATAAIAAARRAAGA